MIEQQLLQLLGILGLRKVGELVGRQLREGGVGRREDFQRREPDAVGAAGVA